MLVDTHKGPNPGITAIVYIVLLILSLVTYFTLSNGSTYPMPMGPVDKSQDIFLRYPHALLVHAFFGFASAFPLGLFTAGVTSRLSFLGVRATGVSIALFGGLTASVVCGVIFHQYLGALTARHSRKQGSIARISVVRFPEWRSCFCSEHGAVDGRCISACIAAATYTTLDGDTWIGDGGHWRALHPKPGFLSAGVSFTCRTFRFHDLDDRRRLLITQKNACACVAELVDKCGCYSQGVAALLCTVSRKDTLPDNGKINEPGNQEYLHGNAEPQIGGAFAVVSSFFHSSHGVWLHKYWQAASTPASLIKIMAATDLMEGMRSANPNMISARPLMKMAASRAGKFGGNIMVMPLRNLKCPMAVKQNINAMLRLPLKVR